MKSIHRCPLRVAITLALLFGIAGVSSPASAQGRGVSVSLEQNGRAVTPYQVVLHAASGSKPGAVSGNVATFAADAISASLDGKPAAVFIDECDDGRIGVHLVVDDDDPNTPAPAAPSNCRRRRLAAVVIIRRGSTIAIDVGRGTVTDTSSVTSSSNASPGGRGAGIGVYGAVSGALAGFNLGADTRTRINGRFTSTSIPYDQYNVNVDDSAVGFAFGGGVNIAVGAPNFGIRVGVVRENELEVPEQTVAGERNAGGLRFQQQGSALVRSWTLHAGPTWKLPHGLLISGGPSFTVWELELRQTGQLEAGCPTLCRVVITDNNTERSSGSDFGFQVGADYYPGDGWLGMQVLYRVTTLHDAYDPSRPLGYRSDWRGSNVFVGGVVQTPRRGR
jgi:hypothetical protein